MPATSQRDKLAAWTPDVFEDPSSDPVAAGPYLTFSSVEVYVRDQSLSRRFYLEKLGFALAFDSADSQEAISQHLRAAGFRWLVVRPSIFPRPLFLGGSSLVLVKPKEGSEEARRIGLRTGAMFVTDNIGAKYQEWTERGVRFEKIPTPIEWGIHATFADLDGNLFELFQSPVFVQLLESERRAQAERQEAQRRATFELSMAKEVQTRLFPQRMPELRTLSYAGRCIQARQVGGDYYDFLELGAEKLGLVLGDVAGKGFAAALLMANLQANLRGQYALAVDDLKTMLKSVNRLFYENTSESSYATLFFGEYNDRTRRLRYVSCGHLPALLVQRQGRIRRLARTLTVLGLFPDWKGTVGETSLEPGDSLVLYTDGVTEALSDQGEEFGESRLARLLSAHAHLAPDALLETIVNAVEEFSGQEQEDDITLVVARCGE